LKSPVTTILEKECEKLPNFSKNSWGNEHFGRA
jgi:hypothetical protein